jgi:hypothetical protein
MQEESVFVAVVRMELLMLLWMFCSFFMQKVALEMFVFEGQGIGYSRLGDI